MAEGSHLCDVARGDRAEFDVRDPERVELVPHKAERQQHTVNRKRSPLDEERHSTDVILVAVRQKQSAETRRVLEDVRHVGNDHVDAERIAQRFGLKEE